MVRSSDTVKNEEADHALFSHDISLKWGREALSEIWVLAIPVTPHFPEMRLFLVLTLTRGFLLSMSEQVSYVTYLKLHGNKAKCPEQVAWAMKGRSGSSSDCVF